MSWERRYYNWQRLKSFANFGMCDGFPSFLQGFVKRRKSTVSIIFLVIFFEIFEYCEFWWSWGGESQFAYLGLGVVGVVSRAFVSVVGRLVG